MNISLYPHQIEALDKLRTGSILMGGVGTGKSITAIAYYFTKECGGSIPLDGKGMISDMETPKDLYIITTARKRDTLEWDKEAASFTLSKDREASIGGVKVTVDSWNNIAKYEEVKDAFFIFDEQRLVGSGAWVKSFYKIAKANNWIILSATPGDVWMDYVPVFVANGFYRNKTDFTRKHVIFNRFTPYPSVQRYIDTGILEKHRQSIIVYMPYEKHTKRHIKVVNTKHDKEKSDMVEKQRWNIYEEEPIQNASQVCYLLRRITNEDESRVAAVEKLIREHRKVIIFYNFNYELEILRDVAARVNRPIGEWNGHKHQPIPDTDTWVYLVQYTAGAEGWNCTETNVIIFYSQNYSYKTMEQASGRIDRLNTLYTDLYYYHLRSDAPIDAAIVNALKNKKNFNVNTYIK